MKSESDCKKHWIRAEFVLWTGVNLALKIVFALCSLYRRKRNGHDNVKVNVGGALHLTQVESPLFQVS